VVDHGSTDETAAALASKFPEVERITGDESLWWTGATNLGIRHALSLGATQIMLLNNDCRLAPDAIEKLLKHIEQNDDNAIITPLAKDMTTHETLNLGFTTCLWLGFPSIKLPKLYWRSRTSSKSLALTAMIMGGRGVVIPARVFEQIGLLDEKSLPHYLADHDFYLRCKRSGIALFIATDAVVQVDNTQTSSAYRPQSLTPSQFLTSLTSRKSHRNLADLAAFFKKHYPLPGLYLLGVALNITRYVVLYLVARVLLMLRNPRGG